MVFYVETIRETEKKKKAALLKQQLKINVVVFAVVKSCTYFLGICKVNIKQSVTLPCATSYGSEPAFPPLLKAMTAGIF